MGFFDKLKKINIFSGFGSELTDDFYDELEESLILADTGMDVTLELVEELRRRVKELGSQITADYYGRRPMLVSVLRGSYIFMADLTRAINLDLTVDFMVVSSYGAGTVSSGQVEIKKDLSDSIEGKDLIVVEDILDSGMTLSYLTELLRDRNPASIRIATLLDKPERRKVEIKPDYVGFTIPDEFVVGYGLDYAELYRSLPYVGILDPKVYTK